MLKQILNLDFQGPVHNLVDFAEILLTGSGGLYLLMQDFELGLKIIVALLTIFVLTLKGILMWKEYKKQKAITNGRFDRRSTERSGNERKPSELE